MDSILDINDILNELVTIQNNQQVNQKELKKTMRSAMAVKYKAESADQNKLALTNIRTQLTLSTKIDEDSMNEMLARMEAMSSAAIEAGIDEQLIS